MVFQHEESLIPVLDVGVCSGRNNGENERVRGKGGGWWSSFDVLVHMCARVLKSESKVKQEVYGKAEVEVE